MQVNFKKSLPGGVEDAVKRVTDALGKEGFGVLNRIDLHEKFKEKLGKQIRPVVILGACHPQLAYEAFTANTDIASLIPCNAVIRDLGDNKVSVELAKPSVMMEMIGEKKMAEMAKSADAGLQRVLEGL